MGGTVSQDRYSRLDFTTNEETWVVAPFVLVSGGADSGVLCPPGVNTAKLTNNGNIYSQSNLGAVSFRGDNGIITNKAGALIKGGDAVVITGVGTTLDNRGTLIGFGQGAEAVYLGVSSDLTVITNTGQILSPTTGIYIAAEGSVPAVIHNAGLIKASDAGGTGVEVAPSPNTNTVIDNQEGGTIEATTAVHVFNGSIALINKGVIKGGVDCDASTGNVSDKVVNKGRITGDIHLGPGNDRFNGADGEGTATLFGDEGNDQLTTGSGADQLNGGAGDDTLRGGLGRDLLTGGGGRDIFDFDSIAAAGKGTARDRVVDLNRALDERIDLHDIDAKSGVAGNQDFHFIGTKAFHNTKGELRCSGGIVQGDVDGDGGADFEIGVNLATLVSGDFFL
jgi:Ca2+-binding RTX toxin-like protein